MNTDLNQLLTIKRKYVNLKNSLESISNNLNNCIENLDIPSKQIKSIYNIDSISIDSGSLSTTRENLINEKNYINNTVLVEINKQLKDINIAINGVE